MFPQSKSSVDMPVPYPMLTGRPSSEVIHQAIHHLIVRAAVGTLPGKEKQGTCILKSCGYKYMGWLSAHWIRLRNFNGFIVFYFDVCWESVAIMVVVPSCIGSHHLRPNLATNRLTQGPCQFASEICASIHEACACAHMCMQACTYHVIPFVPHDVR